MCVAALRSRSRTTARAVICTLHFDGKGITSKEDTVVLVLNGNRRPRVAREKRSFEGKIVRGKKGSSA